MGTVVGQVWAVRDVMSGIFVVLGMVALLAHLYWYVVFEDHESEHGEMFGVGGSPQAVVSSDAALEWAPEQQQAAQRPVDKVEKYADDEFEEKGRYSDMARVHEKESEYDFQWERPKVGFDGLAGMQPLKAELRAAIKRFSHYQNLQLSEDGYIDKNKQNEKADIADQNGLLLSGPPGNGKTAFATAIAAELNLHFVKIGCGDITSKWVNESAKVIKELFLQAAKQPCVVFFDEFDGVALSRGNGNMHGEDRKVVNVLLSEIDRARSLPIVLIAATNHAEQIDSAISRNGRFDFHIEIPYPDAEARAAIIQALLDKHQLIVDCITLERVVKLWERRSIAFLDATIKRLRETVHERGDFRAFLEDFKFAARAACRKASAIPVDGPKISEIALTKSVRRDAKSLLYRLKNWERIVEMGGETPTGVMLYGPPGTGKSMFVKALARELGDWHVFEIHASEVSRNAKTFQDTVELAQTHRPSIIFLDEADELLAHRSGSWNASATNAILKCIDGFAGKVPEVLFVGATNQQLGAIDPAALRGGRFSEKIYMGLLCGDDLVEFVQKQIQNTPQVRYSGDVNATSIAALFDEAAPADVISFMKRVVNYSFEDACQTRQISMKDFRAVSAMSAVNTSFRQTRTPVD
jgi:transitional endoplasmic reticulum ATPase